MLNPELYSHHNPYQVRDAQDTLHEYKDALAAKLHEKDQILDVGCGTGDVTYKVLQILGESSIRLRRIVATDISPDMIAFAKGHFSDDNIVHEVFDITSDITEFRKAYGTFSVIVSFYCFHWFKDHRKAITNILDLMSPGGVCLIVFVANSPVYDVYVDLAYTNKWVDFMEDFRLFIPDIHKNYNALEYYRELMGECGFSEFSCRLVEKEFGFKSCQEKRSCIEAICPFLQRIPEDQIEDFMTDFMTKLDKRRKVDENNPGADRYEYSLMVAWGVKPGGQDNNGNQQVPPAKDETNNERMTKAKHERDNESRIDVVTIDDAPDNKSKHCF